MLSNLVENLKLGFLDQETNLETWCSNLVSFLNGSFQNGVSFQNENRFENEIKTMIKTTCDGFETLSWRKAKCRLLDKSFFSIVGE